MTLNERLTKSVKNTIRITRFKYKKINGELKYELRYNKLLKFNELDELFSKKPKLDENEISFCYVLNSLKYNKDDEKLSRRAILENADFPFIIYVDIDFKTDEELNLFKKDYGGTPEDLLNKLKKDKSVWISGHSGGGKGIRILFLVFNYWAHETKFNDYKTIYQNNYKHILKLLKENYNLNYYDEPNSINYIDRAPISNMILKTHKCLDDEYKNINLDCNVIIHRNELKTIIHEPITGVTIKNTTSLPDEIFTHYNDEILSNAFFGDEQFRKEIYTRYLKSYNGSGLKSYLSSFDIFNNYLNTKSYKYASPLNNYISIDCELENNKKIVEEEKIEPPKQFDYKSATREEIKKYTRALGKIPAKSAIDLISNEFDFNKKYKLNDYLFYPLLREKELGIIFGISGEGKSVLSVQIANYIAKGQCDWKDFRVETQPQPVVYIDFELGKERFSERYNKEQLDKNLKIINVKNYDYNAYIGLDNKSSIKIDRALEFIEELALKYDSKVIFIDNLSNIADQVEQAAEADRFISDLYGRMRALDLSIFFIGHTPKIPINAPLSLNQLKGSSSLTKTFESVIGFKRSCEKNKSYIKQVKSRSDSLVFVEDSIGLFEFSSNNGFNLNYIGQDEEENHLNKKQQGRPQKYDTSIKYDVLSDMMILNKSERETSLNYNISRGTISKWKKEYDENINLKGEVQNHFNNKNNNFNNLF